MIISLPPPAPHVWYIRFGADKSLQYNFLVVIIISHAQITRVFCSPPNQPPPFLMFYFVDAKQLFVRVRRAWMTLERILDKDETGICILYRQHSLLLVHITSV